MRFKASIDQETVLGELKDARVAAGLNQNEAALACGYTRNTPIYRIELGRQPLTREIFDAMVTAYKISPSKATRLWKLWENSLENRWWEKYPWVSASVERHYIAEASATGITMASGSTIPDVLQTRGFVRNLCDKTLEERSEDIWEEYFESRQQRARGLFHDRLIPYKAIIPESILCKDAPWGEEQLAHLLNMSDHPTVEYRVVPQSAGIPMTYVSLLKLGPRKEVAVDGFLMGSHVAEEPSQVRKVRAYLRAFEKHTLGPEESLNLIYQKAR